MTTHKKKYQRLTQEFIVSILMNFYEIPVSSNYKFKNYCDDKGLQSKRRSLHRIGSECGIFQLRQNGASKSFALHRLLSHLDAKKKKSNEQLKNIHEGNKVLTDDEISLLVSTCKELSTMGLGIDEDTCLNVVNAILAERIELKNFMPVTRGVVKQIILENSDLLRLTKGNSIGPKRVRQADSDVRDAMFVKLESFVKLLHGQGKIPWKSFADIPAKNISNMDEVATNTHDHRKKVIACKLDLGRMFQEVLGGDSKMPFHITICVTTRADGKFRKFISDVYFMFIN